MLEEYWSMPDTFGEEHEETHYGFPAVAFIE
jgi:hypothetical protein